MTEITLSTGPVNVRRLGMFELDDNVAKDIPAPLTYTMQYQSGPVEMVIDLSKPRQEPKTPFGEVDEGSGAYYDWQEYHRYTAARQREAERVEAYAAYARRCADYIRTRCVDNPAAIITPDDWRLVYAAAFNPLVTQEEIAASMRLSFRG